MDTTWLLVLLGTFSIFLSGQLKPVDSASSSSEEVSRKKASAKKNKLNLVPKMEDVRKVFDPLGVFKGLPRPSQMLQLIGSRSMDTLENRKQNKGDSEEGSDDSGSNSFKKENNNKNSSMSTKKNDKKNVKSGEQDDYASNEATTSASASTKKAESIDQKNETSTAETTSTASP